MTRRLSLKSEHLTELTSTELGAVAGGVGAQETTLCTVIRATQQITWHVRTAVESVACTLTCWC